MAKQEMNRRDALKTLAALTAAVAAPAIAGARDRLYPTPVDRLGVRLPERQLGKGGPAVTIVGLGGWWLSRTRDERLTRQMIEMALAGGVRFFDTAAAYLGGESESRLGRLLTSQYRDVICLSTRTVAGSAREARKQLESSLRRMRTEYLDLWQMDELLSPAMVDQRLRGGVLEVMLDAQRQGKIRRIGFAGETSPAAHLRILAADDVVQACQMPMSAGFVDQVLPAATARGVGLCAVRPSSERGSADQWLRRVWSLPVSTALLAPTTTGDLAQPIACARRFAVSEARGMA
jgi:predicted aldo/keto reductase-like oxidoreductase